ncbi:MAG: hypothetical protein KF810_16840 [Rhizobiaceae bacterium]|nr:hypothetical protein [Rhizobiaceae bacterium]
MTRINILDGGGPVDVEWIDVINNATGLASSHSFSVDTGSGVSNKTVILAVHYRAAASTNARIGSATIDGVSASILRQDALDAGTEFSEDNCIAFLGAKVSSGDASLPIVINATGGNIGIVYTGSYKVRNLLSLTPVDVGGGATGITGTIDGITRNVDCLEGGVVFGGVGKTNPGTFTQGVTDDYNTDGVSAGHYLVTADELNRAVRYQRTSVTIYVAMSVVSLR